MSTPTPTRVDTSGALAALVGGRLAGCAEVRITGVASLAEAEPHHVSFLGNPLYRSRVVSSAAGTVIVPEDFAEPPPAGRAWIVCADPSAAFMQAVALFAPPPVSFEPGVHRTAVVHETAVVPATAHVGAGTVLEAGVVLGRRTIVGAGGYVGQETRIGDDCLIYPNVTVRERCLLGNRVIIHSGTVIGSDGFGYIPGKDGHTKIPQVGTVQIDDDVEIGAQVAIDRARFGRTWIRRGAKIDNLVQIAHNVIIGEHCFVIAQAGISGSTRIGNGAILAGQAGVAGHIEVGDGAVVMAQAGVTKNVAPGAHVFGSPATDPKIHARNQFALKNVAKLQAALRQLQLEVAALRHQIENP